MGWSNPALIPLFGIGHNNAGAKRRPLTRQFCYRGIRDQRMIAKAKDSHPEGRRREKGVCGMGQGGACRPVHPALVLAEPVRVRAGPRSRHPHPVRFFIGQSASLAPLNIRGAAGGVPAEVGVEGTACGLRPGRKLPPAKRLQVKIRAESACRGSSPSSATKVDSGRFRTRLYSSIKTS